MMAATGNELVILSQLKWFKDNVVAGMVSQTIAEEASEREKQDGLLEDQIIAKIGAANIKAGTGISVSQSGSDVTIASTVKDTNTTYTLSKSGSTIKLTGSDGSSTTVTDADTKYTLPAATASALGGVKVGSGLSVSSGTISTSLSNLGVTATATELNYMDGVTSNVQTQLNGKAASTHKHAAADITSGTLSSDRLPTVPVSKGGTGATSVAAARTALGVQNPITASVALTNQNLNSYNTEPQCGWYYAGGGNSVTSKPSGVDAFGMFVMRTASGLYTQFLYDSNNKLWTRTYSDSTWSTWVALVRTTDTIAKAASATNATNATNATKATQDSAGQTINTTYVKSVTASGRTVTVTKGNGTTSTFQTQDTTYGNMGGASTSAAGRAGLVPAPSQGNANRYLRSDGTWQVPPDTNTTYSAATTSTVGLMSASDKTKLDSIATGANKTTVDSALSSTSTNPVQNKVINSALAGKAASSHTHPASQVTGLTANRALISDANGHPAVSTVTNTELGYLDGVTSSIQSQLNGKAASSHTHNYAGSSSAGGPANSAVKLQTVRTINGTSFDGTANITLTSMGAESLDGKSQSLNSLTLSSGTPRIKWYYCPTDGGGANITGRPSDNNRRAFSLQCELSRYASSSDFVVKQTYVQHDTHQTWVRYGTGSGSGVSWTAWGKAYTSQDKPTASEIGALASNGNAASATKLQTARTISLTGNVTGSASFNGTANASITATIANNAVTTARIADKAVTPAKMASDPVYIVSSASSTTSISGKTVVKPCILVVTGTNPPQIIYDDGK